MKIPAQVIQNIKDLAAQHDDLLQGDDDQRRSLMKLINEQDRFDLGPKHGWKSADAGRPPGKDAVAYLDDNGDVYVADVFGGNVPRSYNGTTEYELTIPRQNFIAVEPVDHLGHIVPPPPPPGGLTENDVRRIVADMLDSVTVSFNGSIRVDSLRLD